MKLVRIAIRKLSGLDEAIEIDSFADGVTLISGPNGIGKSSLIRAVRAVIWPDSYRDPQIDVTLEWESGARRFLASRFANSTTWTTAGKPVAPPPLPSMQVAHCFTIQAEDLRDQHESDDELKRRLIQELAGGYDFRALFESEPIALTPRHGQKTRLELLKRLPELETLRNQQRQLLERSRQVKRLEAEVASGRQAESELKRIESALKLRALRRELSSVLKQLAEFPEGLATLHGQEASDLQALEDAIERAETRLARVQEELRTLESERDAEAGKRVLSRSELDSLRDIVADLKQRELEIDRLNAQLEELGSLLGDGDPTDARDLPSRRVSSEDLEQQCRLSDRLAEAERSQQSVEEEVRLLERRLARMGEAPFLDRVESLGRERSTEVERDLWITVEWERGRSGWVALQGSLLAVGGLFGALCWLLAREVPALAIVASLGALLTVLVIQGLLVARRRPVENRLRDLGLDRVGTPDSIRETLEAWRRAVAQAEQRHSVREQLNHSRERLEVLERRVEASTEALIDFQSELGVEAGPLEGRLFLERALERDRREAELRALEVRRSRLREERDRDLETSRRSLSDWFSESKTSTAALRRALAEANEFAARAAERSHRLESLEQKRREFSEDRLEKAAERERWLTRWKNPRDRQELAEWIALLPEFRALEERKLELRAQIESLRADTTADLEETSESSLEARRHALCDTVERYPNLIREIATTEQEIRQVTREGELAQRLAEVTELRSEFAERRVERTRGLIGRRLLEWALAEYREKSQPRVLKRASEWFSRFTRYRYELLTTSETVLSEASVFSALDTVKGRAVEISKLSSGTRVQLLLAVRLAFASDQHDSFPIFLDEALTFCDADRQAEIRSSIEEFVKTSRRQVIYLTCQEAEIPLWNELDLTPSHLPLDRLRDTERSRAAELQYRPPERVPVPPPQNVDASEYARQLGVPRFEPERGWRGIHLYYLLSDNLSLLYECVRRGLETAGQAQAVVAQERGDWLAPGDHELLVDRLGVTEQFVAAWTIGRGRQLTPRDIMGSTLTPVFKERLLEMARDLRWNTQKLVEELRQRDDQRVKGLRENKEREFLNYLSESGAWDPRSPLSASALKERVLEKTGGDPQSAAWTDHFWRLCQSHSDFDRDHPHPQP